MSKQITFTNSISGSAAISVTVTAVAGSLEADGEHDDRGGGTIPQARGGDARVGKCDVVMTDANAAAILSLVSPVGVGDFTVGGGVGDNLSRPAYAALVDVELGGDGVQVATISWKGTKA